MKIKSLVTAPLGFLSAMILVVAVTVVALPHNAVAAETTKDAKTTKTDTKPAAKTYNYVAQSGDSYTKMARKAVQTYGIENKVKLSNAQIIFAETNLTAAAGSPELNLGQKVSLEQATVKSWIDKAQKLTPTQEAAWNYYVQFVDFNTNNVGEAR